MENSIDIPQKIKTRTTTQSSNSTIEYFSEENKINNLKSYNHPYVHCNNIYNTQETEPIEVPTDR